MSYIRRKLFLTAICAASVICAQAQMLTNYDTQLFSQRSLNGTARFLSVGGAMGAIGGDATTIHYNPAGIGIYRSSEITASLNVHWNNTTLSTENNTYKSPMQTYTSANLQNVTYVGHWDCSGAKQGFLGISFGASYNRMQNIDRNGSYSRSKNYSKTDFLAYDAKGQDYKYMDGNNFNNEAVGYRAILGYQTFMFDVKDPIEKTYSSYFSTLGDGRYVTDNVRFSERGHTDEFAISLATNISNIFYLGMSFICDYTSYSRTETYAETLYPSGRKLETSNSFNISGTGFTYKIGFIVRPTSWLRIGGAYHTPSYYYVTNSHNSAAFSNIDGGQPGSINTPISRERAYIHAPMKAIASLGFVLGKYGFIGVDYQWTNESGTKLKSNTKFDNTTINNITKAEFCDTHTVRVGFEVKPIDAFSIRIGGGYRTAASKKESSRYYYTCDTRTDTHYLNDKGAYNVTAGLGYRIGRHSLDIAYMWHVNYGEYFEFNTSELNIEPLVLRDVTNQIVLTYGVRF